MWPLLFRWRKRLQRVDALTHIAIFVLLPGRVLYSVSAVEQRTLHLLRSSVMNAGSVMSLRAIGAVRSISVLVLEKSQPSLTGPRRQTYLGERRPLVNATAAGPLVMGIRGSALYATVRLTTLPLPIIG